MTKELNTYNGDDHSREKGDYEGYGYHIVDNTKRPLFTEEDLLRGDLDGNYVLITGQNPPFVGVTVRKPTEAENIAANIALAPLRKRMGDEVELLPEEQAILDDPRSLRGANMSFINAQAELLAKNRLTERKKAIQGKELPEGIIIDVGENEKRDGLLKRLGRFLRFS